MAASMKSIEEQALGLSGSAAALDPAGRIAALRAQTSGRIVFTTSFGLEDQALTHLIVASGLAIDIVTLDTGRLFPETYAVWRQTEERYGLRIRAFYPDTAAVEDLVAAQGVDGFYGSVDARHACCHVRKVAPLARALDGAAAWVTGLRSSQSQHRQGLPFFEFDATRGLIKANPILDWTREQTLAFAHAHDAPLNPLHARGFPSIGCAPCTRAVEPGEDERAGRWWWERSDKECGLHVGPDGRLTRAKTKVGASA